MSSQTTFSVIQIEATRIPQERIEAMARPALAAVRKAFEDPAIAAEYEAWLQARRSSGIARAEATA